MDQYKTLSVTQTGKILKTDFRNIKIELIKDKKNNFRVRGKSKDGATLFTSDGYIKRQSAKKFIDILLNIVGAGVKSIDLYDLTQLKK
jgi:uncharacterized protein YegP (UPF0339 family)